MLITGVGTGGHITGCARVLKEKFPKLKVFAVEPSASPVHQRRQAFAASDPGHRRRLRSRRSSTPSLLDGVIQVEADAAKDMARRAAREEGMLVGISSGATLAAIAKKLPEIAARRDGARLQLRHRRALPVDARFPAERVAASAAGLRRLRPTLGCVTPRSGDARPSALQVEHPRLRDQLEAEASMRLLGDEPIALVHVEPPRRGEMALRP